jgi:glycerol kinase
VTAILALDQGTTGSAAIVFDEDGRARASADREIAQHYPASGHVEHDANEIFATTVAVGREALAAAGLDARDVAADPPCGGLAEPRERRDLRPPAR